MRYQVRAVDQYHQLQIMEIEAVDEASLLSDLRSQGLEAVQVTTGSSSSWFHSVFEPTSSRTLPSNFLDVFNTELGTLIGAGLSLIEALEVMSERELDQKRLEIYQRLRRDIQHGHRFSAALALQPEVFTPLYVGLIRASEETSELSHAFHQFGEYAQRRNVLRQRITSALIYPTILSLVGGAVILFLMLYVVPRFSEVYKDTGRALPWMSQALLAWGHCLKAHASMTLTALAASATLIVLYLRRVGMKPLIAVLSLIPRIKLQLDQMEYSRLYLTLSLLLKGGIPLAEALDMVKETVSSDTQEKLQIIARSLQQGENLSTCFENTQLADVVSLRLIRVGEKSGQLATMLYEAGKLQENEASRWVEELSKTFEPLLMTLIGLVVGGIVVLLYMPIFDLAGSLQ